MAWCCADAVSMGEIGKPEREYDVPAPVRPPLKEPRQVPAREPVPAPTPTEEPVPVP